MVKKSTILVIDDDPDILKGLEDRLKLLGFQPILAENGEKGLDFLRDHVPNLVLLDLALPGISGLDVLAKIVKWQEESSPYHVGPGRPARACHLPIIVLTAHGSVENAIEAMKRGAYDFLTKPFEMDHLTLVIEKAIEREALRQQVVQLQAEVGRIIGQSRCIKEVIDLANQAAQSDATVLLLGGSGTGKELFARAIHRWSPRHEKAFAVINCAALPATLLENELFGHEKGAFTGADRLHQGRLESANEGTIFLDEIGDMPLGLQGRLLRVLQNHEIQRVGGKGTIEVDVRFIAATNQAIRKKVEDGQFREDLYYRLNVVTIQLPTLRERPEDIADLANSFLLRYANRTNKSYLTLSAEAMHAMLRYHWPGNIRELENVIERAVVLAKGREVTAADLNLMLIPQKQPLSQSEGPRAIPYHQAMESYGCALIKDALRKTGGNRSKAAEELKISRTYLNKIIKKKGISDETR